MSDFMPITDFLITTILFGKPLIFWSGIILGLSFITTLTFGYLTYKGKIEFKWHKRVAITTAVLFVIHAIIGLLLYL
jgi:hypothetical protein